MHDEYLAASLSDGAYKISDKVVVFNLVNPNTVLDSDWNADTIAHGFDTIGDQLGFVHQTRTKGTALYPLAGAAAIQVDFVIAPILAKLGGFGQVCRLTATQLQRDGVFFGIKTQVPCHIPVQQSPGGDHLGIEQGVLAQ